MRQIEVDITDETVLEHLLNQPTESGKIVDERETKIYTKQEWQQQAAAIGWQPETWDRPVKPKKKWGRWAALFVFCSIAGAVGGAYFAGVRVDWETVVEGAESVAETLDKIAAA